MSNIEIISEDEQVIIDACAAGMQYEIELDIAKHLGMQIPISEEFPMPEEEQPAILQSVSISVSPQIWLSQYHSLKPFASVTIGIPPGGLKDTHLDFASAHLRKAFYKALATEIELVNDASGKVAGKFEDTTELAQYCQEQLGDITQQPSFKVKLIDDATTAIDDAAAKLKTAVEKSGGQKAAVKASLHAAVSPKLPVKKPVIKAAPPDFGG